MVRSWRIEQLATEMYHSRAHYTDDRISSEHSTRAGLYVLHAAGE